MNQKENETKPKIKKTIKKLLWTFGGTAAAVAVVFGGYKGFHFIKTSSKSLSLSPNEVITKYVGAITTIQLKMDELRKADEENARLRLENANMKRWSEALRFNCSASDAQAQTDKLGMKLTEETGARAGRVLASIQYRPPTHLLPDQLYTLAVSYMKAEEDEKAAVILTYLTGFEGDNTYKNPRHYLLTGIAWYRLDHFKLADSYFDKIMDFPENSEYLQYQAQARLWKALVSERTNQPQQTQRWLHELVDHHPYSIEAAWVNSLEPGRLPSSTGNYHYGSENLDEMKKKMKEKMKTRTDSNEEQ